MYVGQMGRTVLGIGVYIIFLYSACTILHGRIPSPPAIECISDVSPNAGFINLKRSAACFYYLVAILPCP